MRDKVSGKFERMSDEDYLKRVENRFEGTFQLDLITFNGDNVTVFCKSQGDVS